MKMSVQICSRCGVDCGECPHHRNGDCAGCFAEAKTPVHSDCKVKACVTKKGIRFCGECGELPCKVIAKYSGHKRYGDQPKGARIERCKQQKAALVREARQGINPVAVCGHHCDYCFLGQWCGGCRSNYNCCSYAGLYEDHQCPNVVCASEKGLDGCYACSELRNCPKGYYAKPDEFVAKATAIFIQKYGQACYTATLKSAVAKGINYPKDFDAAGSVDGALQLLEDERKTAWGIKSLRGGTSR